MALKMPTRVPVAFKPYIFFFHGRWHAGTHWLFPEPKCKAAKEFVDRINSKVKP